MKKKLVSQELYMVNHFYNNSKYNYMYRQMNCYEVCICKQLTKQCNCSCDNIYELTNANKNCLDNNECYEKGLREFNFIEKCQDLCPLKCNTSSFRSSSQEFEISFDEYGTKVKESFENYSSQFNLTMNKNRTLGLNVFFDELKYTKSIQIPKITIPSLVSTLGGTLGLFLGLSLLSFVEILDFLIQLLFILKENVSSINYLQK
jgi:hypothetical protein